ncbi:tachykinin-like peptides receptor 99D [Calliphora vicina]|uniref:tachykinin-like peptides receptor 99D n=1 Tax=Calliphora vicina TaxID=7373 RepID=UPI00325B61EA
MLDLNIPTANPITTTLAPHDDDDGDVLQRHLLATEMSNSLQFDSISKSLANDASAIAMATNTTTALNWNTASQTATANNISATAVPMVNIATNFIYDWCNQSSSSSSPSSYPAITTGNGIGSTTGGNCSLYTTSLNSWNNSTNDTSVDISFILPWWRQVLWSILFGGMVIVATGGNLIVVWIVMTTKRMRTVTNYFIVNLSIADAMVSSLNVTFNYIYMLDNDWPFGELYCKISQFIATLSISASVFTLMAISIDRYVAIMKPLKPRMSKRNNLAIAAVIWLVSAIISCPMLLFFTTDVIPSKDGLRTVCYTEWPDGSTNHSHHEYIYNILFMILTYFLPIISMSVTYSRVGLELWGSKAIGEYTPRQVENVKSKRRVVKMMIVVVLIFAVCWLPFHTYFILTSCYPAITETPFIQELYLFIYWLAMSNSMYNPIIYCWMNSRFRFGFKMFFRWCPFVHIGAESLNRRDQMTSRYSCSGSPDHNRIKRNDTQRSFLYTCPGSPKNRRISHCGILRSSTIATQRDGLRHSAPITTLRAGPGGGGAVGNYHHHNSTYHQRCSLKTPDSAAMASMKNTHELSALSGNGQGPTLALANNSKDFLIKTNQRSSVRWTTPAVSAQTPPSSVTATTSLETSSAAYNGGTDTNYLANRAAIMS